MSYDDFYNDSSRKTVEMMGIPTDLGREEDTVSRGNLAGFSLDARPTWVCSIQQTKKITVKVSVVDRFGPWGRCRGEIWLGLAWMLDLGLAWMLDRPI